MKTDKVIIEFTYDEFDSAKATFQIPGTLPVLVLNKGLGQLLKAITQLTGELIIKEGFADDPMGGYNRIDELTMEDLGLSHTG